MIEPELLKYLVCPETKQPLRLAKPEEVDAVNRRIGSSGVTSRSGEPITAPVETLLVREDGAFGYPVRGGIPVMLIDESVPLDR